MNHHQIDDGLKNASKLYLWTERGALLHAKSLNTDRAWEVYDRLVETYFRASKVLRGKATGKTEGQLAAETKRAAAMPPTLSPQTATRRCPQETTKSAPVVGSALHRIARGLCGVLTIKWYPWSCPPLARLLDHLRHRRGSHAPASA